MSLKLENIIVHYYLIAILRHDALLTHRQRAMPVCLRVASAGGAESIILSAGGAESMMLSACTESMNPLSAGADSIILSAPLAESMILSALFGCVIMLTAVATKKINGNTDDPQFLTIVNSASIVAPIVLPPKMAKFCHTFNRLLVGHQHRRALLLLYLNFSAVGWLLVVGHLLLVGRSVQNMGSWALGVSLQKDKTPQHCPQSAPPTEAPRGGVS